MFALAQVWSCGGGVQSAAIAGLIVQGRLPKPDYSIIVDTEYEKSTTWAYYESVLKPNLARVGVDLVRIPKSLYATVDLYGKNGDLLLPAYTTQNGTVGKLQGFCSNEWKKRVIMRWCRDQGIKACENWIGISTNELARVRAPEKAWFRPRYVLIYDVPLSRHQCEALVRDIGWPPAPRSSCYICPHLDDEERRTLTESDRTARYALEAELQKRDPCVFLDDPRPKEPNNCQTGFCFT